MTLDKTSKRELLGHYQAVIMLLAAMALAGSSVVVGKILVFEVPVFVAAFLSLLVAFLCMLPMMHGRWGEIVRLSTKQWRYLFLQGLCGIVLFRIFTLYGLQRTGATEAGIITGATPAVLAILSYFFLKETVSLRMLLGIFCAVLGCITINVFTAAGSHDQSSIFGGLLVGCAVVSEALFTIFRKKVWHSVSAVTNTAVLIFCSLLLLLIPALLQYQTMRNGLSKTAIAAIVYYGAFATVVAYLLWTGAVGRVNGAIAGAATAAMPASSVLLAILILKESPSQNLILSFVLIVFGILLTSYRPPSPSFIREEDRNKR